MSFKRVDECLPAWLIEEIAMMKSGASAKPAPSYREVITKAEARTATANRTHMRPALRVISSRCFDTALPRRVTHRGAVSKHLVLVVDNAHQTVSGARVSRW